MPQLQGIRLHLSGSIPVEATASEAGGIKTFVELLTKEVLSKGGAILHGSHPTLIEFLHLGSEQFRAAGGRRDSLTLVRSRNFCVTSEHQDEIRRQREWASVEIVPSLDGDINASLIPLREYMAERCDIIVSVGGKWYDANVTRAGVPLELEEMLKRGKPGVIVSGFGGATRGYLNDHPELLRRLKNGFSEEKNRELATSTDPLHLVQSIVAQIAVLPLVRNAVRTTRLFRVLALDGGGLRGTFTAAVLAKWAELLGGNADSLIKHFDLVAGTSTGAILALGLSVGLSPAEILRFYKDKGNAIFPSDRGLRHWLKSKHDAKTLKAALDEVFGDRSLSDSCCRLVIPTVRARNGEAEIIVTPHHPDRSAFRSYTTVDAALASAAAPTYFDEAEIHDGVGNQQYLDGGIWANNPVLPAIVEAVRHLDVPLERLDVLSVGTLACEQDFMECLGKGKAGWAPSSASLFFSAQESGALLLANALLGRSRHLRVNQNISTDIPLDNTDAIEEMASRGSNVGKDTFDVVHSRFLDGFLAGSWK